MLLRSWLGIKLLVGGGAFVSLGWFGGGLCSLFTVLILNWQEQGQVFLAFACLILSLIPLWWREWTGLELSCQTALAHHSL